MTISAQQARKIMGKKADKYTDEQLEEVINIFTVLSDIIIDDYIAKRKLRKKQK